MRLDHPPAYRTHGPLTLSRALAFDLNSSPNVRVNFPKWRPTPSQFLSNARAAAKLHGPGHVMHSVMIDDEQMTNAHFSHEITLRDKENEVALPRSNSLQTVYRKEAHD
ncbi:hypothetical protein LTR28_005242, partial [Elasticomyces elasticus]